MAISRYWRLVGICTPGNGALELSEARIYENGVLADAGAVLSCTFVPDSGALADLRDDLTTGVVSWGYAKYSAPGFALVWDFGVGGGVEFPRLRLGSGSASVTYPLDLVAQASTDGVNWVTYAIPIVGAAFPGVQTLTNLPPAGIDDPYWHAVVLAMHMDGANGSTVFTDLKGNTVTPTGTAQISAGRSKFGGASSLFNGSSDALRIPFSSDFLLPSSGFTIELFVYIAADSAPDGSGLRRCGLFGTATPGTSSYMTLLIDGSGSTTGSGFIMEYQVAGVAYTKAVTVAISKTEWHHIAVCADATSTRFYVDGVGLSNPALPVSMIADAYALVSIGSSSTIPSYFRHLNGSIDDLRITKGVARYTANFTPPTSAFKDTFEFLPVNAVPPSRTRQLAPTPERLLPVSELPVTTAHGHLREYPFFDTYHGGIGLITGTVKEKALPANTPLHRRVLLVDERSQLVIRETWSDAVTGAYEFRGVKQGVKYTVLSYDHTGLYRAVIADNIIPDQL